MMQRDIGFIAGMAWATLMLGAAFMEGSFASAVADSDTRAKDAGSYKEATRLHRLGEKHDHAMCEAAAMKEQAWLKEVEAMVVASSRHEQKKVATLLAALDAKSRELRAKERALAASTKKLADSTTGREATVKALSEARARLKTQKAKVKNPMPLIDSVADMLKDMDDDSEQQRRR